MEEQKKRKKRKINGKRIIPVLIAIALIILIVGIFYGEKIIAKYSYSSERADMNEYFQIFSEQDVAVILQDEMTEYRARMSDGHCYFDMNTVEDLFVQRFYVNEEEQTISYTDATDIIKVNIGGDSNYYSVSGESVDFGYPITIKDGDTIYLAADYVRKYANFSYEIYPEPYRMVLYTSWGTLTKADIAKDTWVRRLGGVKSPILRDMAVGESVYILDSMEEWSKVRTEDGIIGYVENKRLANETSVAQTPVTDVAPLAISGVKKDFRINMAFHQVFAQSGNDTFDSYCDGMVGVNVIAPTWLRLLDSDGNLDNISSTAYVEKAHTRGMEVWAVFTDVDHEVELKPLLSSSEKRAALIQNLIAIAVQYDYDGINIDFESVKSDTGEDFVQFLRELSIQTRANGLVLSVDNYAPTATTAHYNRSEQGIYADYVIVMGYDEHWGGGGVAGSVASLPFVENGILNTIAEVPADKVINAIPFYTRLWKTDNGAVTSEAIGMDRADQVLAELGVTPEWDEGTCQYYAEYTSGNAYYQIWLENEDSIRAKLNVMNVNQVAGVAAWKLGFERDSIWELLASYVNME